MWIYYYFSCVAKQSCFDKVLSAWSIWRTVWWTSSTSVRRNCPGRTSTILGCTRLRLCLSVQADISVVPKLLIDDLAVFVIFL